MRTHWYAVLRHRPVLFGLVMRYDLVTFQTSFDDAVGFAYNVMGFETDEFTVKRVTNAEKTAMTLSLLGG